MPPQQEDDEWTTIRPRRRNNKAQNDQLKERLAIPVVPLTAFAALEIEHNPVRCLTSSACMRACMHV